MADEVDGSSRIQGPDVAVISWIPYAYDLADMTPNEFTRHRHAAGFGWLFDSGNPTPPDRFSGQDEFLDYLARREFRGACSLRDVVLTCGPDGSPTRFDCRPWEGIGYTPYRYANSKERRKLGLRHARGQKRATDSSPMYDSGGSNYNLSFCFRVGRLGDLASWAFTRGRAPWVGVGVDYRMEIDGSVQVRFHGSFIPSRRFYVDWKAVGLHDMCGVSSRVIDDFLNTGRDRNAPGDLLADWNGPGRRC